MPGESPGWAWVVALLVAAYLCGAIPFGLLAGWCKGVDIRTQGSRNIGATNAGRILGRPWGILVFILDFLKGFLPVSACRVLLFARAPTGGHATADHIGVLLVVVAATLAVVGHIYPVYLRFKGGKGVATSLGVGLAIYPYYTLAGLLAFAVWGAVLALARFVSIASVLAVMSFPVLFAVIAWINRENWGGFTDLWPLYLFSIVVAALVVYRHWSNLRRFWAGSERRMGSSEGGRN